MLRALAEQSALKSRSTHWVLLNNLNIWLLGKILFNNLNIIRIIGNTLLNIFLY